MGLAQLGHWKSLGGLGCPEATALWRGGDRAIISHLFDRVGNWRGGDHRPAGLHGAGEFIGYMGMLENGRAMEAAEAMDKARAATPR